MLRVIVVSNTSPLNYLILIDRVGILPTLFQTVVAPETVARELAHERAPDPVRAWIANPTAWLDILSPKAPDSGIALGVGERDAICLALELSATLLLLDDKAARRVAKERGLRVAGTPGILELASRNALVNLPSAVAALERTSYRIRADVVRKILKE